MRKALWLELREPVEAGAVAEDPRVTAVRDAAGRLQAQPRSGVYMPAAAVLLDLLDATNAAVRDAAALLKTTTGNLIDFLSADEQVWRTVNALRTRHQQAPLHA